METSTHSCLLLGRLDGQGTVQSRPRCSTLMHALLFLKTARTCTFSRFLPKQRLSGSSLACVCTVLPSATLAALPVLSVASLHDETETQVPKSLSVSKPSATIGSPSLPDAAARKHRAQAFPASTFFGLVLLCSFRSFHLLAKRHRRVSWLGT